MLTIEKHKRTFLSDPLVTSLGVKSPFLVGCNSLVNSGLALVRQFPSVTVLPEHYAYIDLTLFPDY